jgi:hypothetical protein
MVKPARSNDRAFSYEVGGLRVTKRRIRARDGVASSVRTPSLKGFSSLAYFGIYLPVPHRQKLTDSKAFLKKD